MRRWVANLIYSTSVPPPGVQLLNFRLGLQENNDSVINFKVNNLSSAWRLPIQQANRPTSDELRSDRQLTSGKRFQVGRAIASVAKHRKVHPWESAASKFTSSAASKPNCKLQYGFHRKT